MICKECKHFKKIANTDECGQGICGYPMSYFPVGIEDKCYFIPEEYKCKDCQHFVEDDAACMTADAEDSAYQDYGLCGGFIDKHESEIYNILCEWRLRDLNVTEKLRSILEDLEEFKAPWD